MYALVNSSMRCTSTRNKSSNTSNERLNNEIDLISTPRFVNVTSSVAKIEFADETNSGGFYYSKVLSNAIFFVSHYFISVLLVMIMMFVSGGVYMMSGESRIISNHYGEEDNIVA